MCNEDIQKAFLNGEYSFTLNRVRTTDSGIVVHEVMMPEESKEAYDFVIRAISTYGVADVQEVKHGKPIVYEVHKHCVTGAAVDETGTPFLLRKEYVEERERCPFCNATLFGEWACYCDKCGAKMDEGEDEK